MRTTSSNLKAHLGRYLGAVREGAEVTITDREREIARLVPIRRGTGLVIRPPQPGAPALGTIDVRKIVGLDEDSTSMLLEDRARR